MELNRSIREILAQLLVPHRPESKVPQGSENFFYWLQWQRQDIFTQCKLGFGHTSDAHRSACTVKIRALDDFLDPGNDTGIQAIGCPALEETQVHQRPPAPSTPLWRVDRPPCLPQWAWMCCQSSCIHIRGHLKPVVLFIGTRRDPSGRKQQSFLASR